METNTRIRDRRFKGEYGIGVLRVSALFAIDPKPDTIKKESKISCFIKRHFCCKDAAK